MNIKFIFVYYYNNMSINPLERFQSEYEKEKYIYKVKSVYFNDFSLGLYNKTEEVIKEHQDDYDNILQILDNEYILSNYLSKNDPIIEAYHSCKFITGMSSFQKALVGIILLETYESDNQNLMTNINAVRLRLEHLW